MLGRRMPRIWAILPLRRGEPLEEIDLPVPVDQKMSFGPLSTTVPAPALHGLGDLFSWTARAAVWSYSKSRILRRVCIPWPSVSVITRYSWHRCGVPRGIFVIWDGMGLVT